MSISDNNKMFCVVFNGPGRLDIEERPVPECPPDGLLVKVMACGICGSDVRNIFNGLKNGVTGQIIGHEIAGIVAEAAPGLRFHEGDAVALAPDISCCECYYCKRGWVNLCERHRMLGTHLPGGFAQYLAVPHDMLAHGFIEQIPAKMPWTHAAFAETVAAVLACQKRIGLSLGDHVLIMGDGPVGCLHAEAARAHGASLVMMVGLDRLALAAAFGADLLLDNHDPETVRRRVMEATNSVGADAVICAVPSANVQEQAVELARKRGMVVLYGGLPKDAPMTTLNSNLIHYNELSVVGSFSYPAAGLINALDAIASGHINPAKYINMTLPLTRVWDGVNALRTGGALKVMLDPWAKE
jgi:L-iditol 2-dehydrogenase